MQSKFGYITMHQEIMVNLIGQHHA